MAVYKAQTVVTNYLDVATSPPINPVDGQKWMDGTVMKTWDETQKEWVSDDLKGVDGKDTYIQKAWSWSSDGTDRFTTKYPNENLFNLKNWFSNKYVGSGNIEFLDINGSPNTKYTIWTNIPETSSTNKNVFFMKNKEEPSSFGNGVGGVRPTLTITTDTTGMFRVGVRVYVPNLTSENRQIKIEKSSESTIYTPSPKDDFNNAYPKYEGYYSSHNPVQSTNPSDYTWTPIPREPGKDGEPGQNAAEVISGSLSNDSIILSATSTGVVSDYSKAYGDFVVYEGQNKLANGVTFSKVSETGMTSSINASGRYTVTNITTDTAMAIYRAIYKGVQIEKQILVVKNKQGSTGPQGPPTGVVESPTIPTEVYQGMLWKNTGYIEGYINDATYIYRGSNWEKYILQATNIKADTLAAIVAILGDVEGGSFTGGKFINNFVDIPLLYDNTRKATGQTKIENGVMTITGKIDGKNDFGTKYTVDAISSTIYYPNSSAVMKAFSLSPDGLLLVDHENGFNGQLLASALTKMPWVNITVRSGFSVNASNPPQYKITYNLDGTKTISFRGQIVRLSNNNIVDMESGSRYNFADLPTQIRPNVEANGYGVTNSGNGAKLYATEQGVMGCLIGLTSTSYLDLGSISYIID